MKTGVRFTSSSRGENLIYLVRITQQFLSTLGREKYSESIILLLYLAYEHRYMRSPSFA